MLEGTALEDVLVEVLVDEGLWRFVPRALEAAMTFAERFGIRFEEDALLLLE